MKVEVYPAPKPPEKIILELTLAEACNLRGLLESYQKPSSSFYNSWYATNFAKPLHQLLQTVLKGGLA